MAPRMPSYLYLYKTSRVDFVFDLLSEKVSIAYEFLGH